MPDQTRIDDSGALSPEEGKRGRIGPLNPAAQGIEDQEVIKKILTHLDLRDVNPPYFRRVEPRPPPRSAKAQPTYTKS